MGNPRTRRQTAGRIVALLTLVVWLTPSIAAGQVRPMNLEEMTARAATIFSGRCIDVSVQDDVSAGRPITVITFAVDRSVKGIDGPTFTLKQIGGHPDDPRRVDIPGLPSFQPGEEVVLFLYGESRLGLASPVGLGQGKFRVLRDKSGARIVQADLGQDRLFRNLTPAALARLDAAGVDGRGRRALGPDRLLDLAAALAE